MNYNDLIKIAKVYVENDVSISELAKQNNMGKSTLVGYLCGNKKIKLPDELQIAVNKKKNFNWINSKATSGNKGHFSFSKEQIISIAQLTVNEKLTLEEISKYYDVVPATIYNLFNEENLGIELYSEIQKLYAENKVNAANKARNKH